jgi:hypothetical protein
MKHGIMSMDWSDNLVMPTMEWQDILSRRLAASIEASLVSPNPSWDTLPGRSVTTASSSVISLEVFETSAPGNRQNNKSENGLVLESALDELYSLDTGMYHACVVPFVMINGCFLL